MWTYVPLRRREGTAWLSIVALCGAVALTFNLALYVYRANYDARDLHVQGARATTPRELRSRPYEVVNGTIPKIIHQSWSSTKLPRKFVRWSSSWRLQHPDWEWVLWTNDDNRKFVADEYPWLLEAYENLPGEIFRADAVRSLYMHRFGGVYADLDVECLRALDGLWDNPYDYPRSTMVVKTPEKLPTLSVRAYLGLMGPTRRFHHSIPNAWMASTPGHPFWLLAALAQLEKHGAWLTPEEITGPVALRQQVGAFQLSASTYSPQANEEPAYEIKSEKSFLDKEENRLVELLADAVETTKRQLENKYSIEASLTILPNSTIYPYSWQDFDAECSAQTRTFSSSVCKDKKRVLENGAYTITYWSHSWTNSGHNKDAVDLLNQA